MDTAISSTFGSLNGASNISHTGAKHCESIILPKFLLADSKSECNFSYQYLVNVMMRTQNKRELA